MGLLEPLHAGRLSAPNRLMFGPHVTNLGDDDRRFTSRHTAYYARRAAGGCGIVVIEGASVHRSDWPYERAPLAERCADGWADIAEKCHAHASTAIAALDHAGSQGSSAYNQLPLWAPSRVPDVNSREVPKWMETDDIEAVIDGFASAARVAVGAGCDGVEINAGQHSLVRQFMSGLTNLRDDEWGADRTLFARRVIDAVRGAAGDAVVGLRLCGDELAPWAGITAAEAPDIAAELVGCGIDYLVVVRGSIYTAEQTRPDFHQQPGFNIDLCRQVKAAVCGTGDVAVFLQGSIVDPGQAEWALIDGVADGVEMTRAQIADPDIAAKLAAGDGDRIRPCILCNQTCQVRDARNPIVTCVGEPSSGHETDDPAWYTPSPQPRDVVVIGGGVAGLETARVAAACGHRVRIVERSNRLGGIAAVAGPGAALVEWLIRECAEVPVELDTEYTHVDGYTHVNDNTVDGNPVDGNPVDGNPVDGNAVDGNAVDGHPVARSPVAESPPGEVVVQCTGGRPGQPEYKIADGAAVIDVAALHSGDAELPPEGPIVLFDPIGGPIAVALAEQLGERAVLLTQDQIAGNELSRSGDLAPAHVRLAQRGVRIERRTLLRAVRAVRPGRPGAEAAIEVEVEDRFSGERRTIAGAALVDCGFRLPTSTFPGAQLAAGDCVAPRTILEAVLEGRRAANAIDAVRLRQPPPLASHPADAP